ncbi:MAG: methyltransferase domain-containing protein [Propionibacteriaceae bacterium]|nr:methyltransferase domain-containing protein [Propionibacteriaceae bacterium]
MTLEAEMSAWYAQQAAVVELRDPRVQAVLEAIRDMPATRGVRVLDLGCGSGTLCNAIAEAFPDAQVIGIDHDPILLRLGQETNRHGDRVRLLQMDLRHPAWTRHLGNQRFDIVVSATDLRWLSPDDLVRLYLSLPEVIERGGVFLGDAQLQYDAESESFGYEPDDGRTHTEDPDADSWTRRWR